ncbi:MAG: AIR synthase-related protein, partial [Mariprofundales bacterium]|nr:AIR synthase-related protein [Mariprofundales bacterium]
SGTIGDHGMAVLSSRENLSFTTTLKSDSAALHNLVQSMIAVAPDIHALRDPTRGGVAATLNELAQQSAVGMMIDEQSIPVRDEVTGACELLGLDPLYVANEGKLICICAAADADRLLAVMRADPLAHDAAVIGRVVEDEHYMVQMSTTFGGMRVVDWLSSEQLPRIC